MKNKPFFLKNVQLSGYKSIKNVAVDFESGLNIIIGKNAAGKTNFLSFLEMSLNTHFHKVNSKIDAKMTFEGDNELVVKTEVKEKMFDEGSLSSLMYKGRVKQKFYIDDKLIKSNESKNGDILNFNIKYHKVFIKHGVPKKYLLIDNAIKTNINKVSGSANNVFGMLENDELSFFVKNVLFELLFSLPFKLKSRKTKISLTIKDINIIIDNINNSIIYIEKYLKKLSPIQNLRINESFNIFDNNNRDEIIINNLFLEFKVQDDWLPFSSLSDGTKRLFYIISEVLSYSIIDEDYSKIILLEEPELGIHPHQLHGLMLFLKEQAEDKQIIISTHSPQVLNILGKDELNKIIIATSEGKKGTVLKHLTEKQKEKAKSYMNDEVLFLSDYWMYSDLEERI